MRIAFHPASSSNRQVEGVACIIVARLRRIRATSAFPSLATSSDAIDHFSSRGKRQPYFQSRKYQTIGW